MDEVITFVIPNALACQLHAEDVSCFVIVVDCVSEIVPAASDEAADQTYPKVIFGATNQAF